MAGQSDNRYGDRGGMPTVLPNGTDLDTVTENGVYFFDYTAVNNPATGSGLLVVSQSESNISQTVYISGCIYNRNTNNIDLILNCDWVKYATDYDISDLYNALSDSIGGVMDTVNAKVDKIPGKSLSTNDYTTAEKTKLNSAVTSSTIAEIVTLTQTAYDALNPKLTTTLYIITGV